MSNRVSAPAPKWREEDGIIYFSVTSDGTSGPDWITRLEGNGLNVDDSAKFVLRSPDFRPTTGVTSEIAILRERRYDYKATDLIAKEIRYKADRHKLVESSAEVACLMCEMITHKQIEDMRISCILVMHKFFRFNRNDAGNDVDNCDQPFNIVCLCLDRDPVNGLTTCSVNVGVWPLGSSFALILSQVSP